MSNNFKVGDRLKESFLTIIDQKDKTYNGRHWIVYIVRCDCGNTKEISFSRVKRYKTCNEKNCPVKHKLLSKFAKAKANISHQKSKLLENKEKNFFILKNIYNKYKSGANTRGIQFLLEPKDFEELWIEQDGKCKQTGLPLDCGSGHESHTWSIDRIDNSKPYAKGNVQMVSKFYNMVKATKTDREIKIFAYLVSQNFSLEDIREFNSMSKQDMQNELKAVNRVQRN